MTFIEALNTLTDPVYCDVCGTCLVPYGYYLISKNSKEREYRATETPAYCWRHNPKWDNEALVEIEKERLKNWPAKLKGKI